MNSDGNKCDITTIILTLNEEKNIEKCINSVKDISKRIVVVDSFSTDNTVVLAKKLGAEVIQHKFVNQAQQFNYSLEVLNLDTKWVFRLDADERVPKEAASEIAELCKQNANTDVNGIVVRFSVHFLGRELRHGGIYPIRVLRIFKSGIGYIEERNMDEHTLLKSGISVEMKNDLVHCDFKQLSDWIIKHNKYSDREMADYLFCKASRSEKDENIATLNKVAKIKRFIKFRVYYKLPMGMRAHMYYLYRYYFRLGFLDGKEGKIFCFLQAYWYRFLVDAKIYEAEKEKDKK